MEPSSISPPPAPPATAVPFPADPNDHLPPPIAEPPSNHPPYAEMIYTAIEALKEKDGSSKKAIGKYMEQVYKDQLPPNHSTLLTQHLTRMKSSGMLVMVKKSYALPRSAAALAEGAVPEPSPSTIPRPRGRPRKAQTPVHNLPQPLAQAQDALIPSAQQNAEPVWAALGLADEPLQAESSKKRPGRPKKYATGTPGTGRRGRPVGSGKGPGRPPKPKPVASDTSASVGPKRRPGRPPKNQTQATQIPFAPSTPTAAAAAVPDSEPLAEPVPAGDGIILGPRVRGRPKKFADEIIPSGRGRGRGREYEESTSAGAPQNAVNEELKRKLEHFQLKVKESLAVIKPHFNHQSPVTAIAAIQDLEELGTMDLNAPLREETISLQQEVPPPQEPVPAQPLQQQPPPPQQQPPQQHLAPPPLQPQPQLFQQPFPSFQLQQPFHHQQPQLQFQQPPQQHQLFQAPPSHHQQFHP